jgi:hypothetical protein
MGTHVIVDARTRKVRASLDAPGEGTTIFAVDLIGDSWDDFTYFRDQARRFESTRDFRLRNRYVRAAISALFSHFEGVVSELFGLLRGETGFKGYLPKNPERCSLRARVTSVAGFLVGERGVALPAIDLEMKLLRDILNHPSITKEAGPTASSDTLVYDGADVYGISIDDLTATASVADHWLNAATTAMGYERFCDTKRVCEEFARALFGTPGSIQEF